jgi:hypothetical protein
MKFEENQIDYSILLIKDELLNINRIKNYIEERLFVNKS